MRTAMNLRYEVKNEEFNVSENISGYKCALFDQCLDETHGSGIMLWCGGT